MRIFIIYSLTNSELEIELNIRGELDDSLHDVFFF